MTSESESGSGSKSSQRGGVKTGRCTLLRMVSSIGVFEEVAMLLDSWL